MALFYLFPSEYRTFFIIKQSLSTDQYRHGQPIPDSHSTKYESPDLVAYVCLYVEIFKLNL